MEVEIILLSCAFWYNSTKASRVLKEFVLLCLHVLHVSIQEFLNTKADCYRTLTARNAFSAFNEYA